MPWTGSPRAVLFDFDGTLVNSVGDIADAMNAVLKAHGFPVHPLEAYRFFVGEGLETLVRRALPEDRRATATLEAVLPAMRAEYADRATRHTRPYDGIPELLDALTDRGIPLAICSNKPQEPLEAMVTALLDRWCFLAVVGARPDLPRKPDPTGALGIATALTIPPADWLYLGDTDTDMATASAAGMRAVGVLWGLRDAEELHQAGAARLVVHPRDVLTEFPRHKREH
ncbi:MAG: HAD family hydrolase [Deferrisomatales bacterium]|nr:HAD family hydrolase [Deferrisomatales bacterium]